MKYLLNTLAAIMAFGMLTVAIPDIAFAGSDKVDVCHIPPGNPENFHTIRISEKALSAHLAHGDLAGACEAGCAVLCDDGNVCTIDDTGDCYQNGCPATPEQVDCNDGNECTADTCDTVEGCMNNPTVGAECNDGQVCTGPIDTCNEAGDCTGVPIDNCCLVDGECSTDLCDQASCDLNTNRCVVDPVVCPAPDLCSVSVCAPNTGECAVTPNTCPTGESCDPNTGDCVEDSCDIGTCDNGFFCDLGTGECIQDFCTEDSCDDGNECTDEFCTPGERLHLQSIGLQYV